MLIQKQIEKGMILFSRVICYFSLIFFLLGSTHWLRIRLAENCSDKFKIGKEETEDYHTGWKGWWSDKTKNFNIWIVLEGLAKWWQPLYCNTEKFVLV